MSRSTVRRLVVASGRPPGRTSATSRWTVFEPMSRTPRRTGRGYRASTRSAARGARHPLTRYDERDVRRTRAPVVAGALALPRDRPRRVVASRGRDRAAADRDRDRAAPRPRRPARHGRGRRGLPAAVAAAVAVRRDRRSGSAPTRARSSASADSTTPFVVGVAGSVAVGKSTIARLLRELMSRWPGTPRVELVTTDGFLYPNAELERRGLMSRKGFPESYDRRALVSFLTEVKSGAPEVRAPFYSHMRYDIVPDAHVDGAPPRRRDRRGAERAAAAADAERRRGERPVRLLDLRRRRQRPHHAVVRRPVPGAAARGVQQPELVLQRLRRTSPTKRRSRRRSGSGTTSTCRTSRRTCCRRKHRATPRAREGGRPHGRAGAAAQALTRRAAARPSFVRAPRITRRLPLSACVESSDTWARGRARPSCWPGSRVSSTAATTPRASR